MNTNDNIRIERICEMERSYDKVSDALKAIEEAKDNIVRLRQYMDSGLWKDDFEADERGELPANLKRGVLSEDGLWNLLEDLAHTLALQNL